MNTNLLEDTYTRTARNQAAREQVEGAAVALRAEGLAYAAQEIATNGGALAAGIACSVAVAWQNLAEEQSHQYRD